MSAFLLLTQNGVTGRSTSQDAGLQPCKLWAKEVLSEGVYLRGGWPGSLSWHHTAAQRDDGEISCANESIAGVRVCEGKKKRLFYINWTILSYCDIMLFILYDYIKGPSLCSTLKQQQPTNTWCWCLDSHYNGFSLENFTSPFMFIYDATWGP